MTTWIYESSVKEKNAAVLLQLKCDYINVRKRGTDCQPKE